MGAVFLEHQCIGIDFSRYQAAAIPRCGTPSGTKSSNLVFLGAGPVPLIAITLPLAAWIEHDEGMAAQMAVVRFYHVYSRAPTAPAASKALPPLLKHPHASIHGERIIGYHGSPSAKGHVGIAAFTDLRFDEQAGAQPEQASKSGLALRRFHSRFIRNS